MQTYFYLLWRFRIAALLAASLAGMCGCSQQKAQSGGAPPPVPVSVALVTREAAPVEIRAIGTVEPSSTVQVKSQIGGQLLSVKFEEGASVNEGDLLFEIDPRPYQEALRQAEAAIEKDMALMRQAEATVARDAAQEKFAQADAQRYASLAKEGVMSRSQTEQVRASADALHESVRAGQAAIESARASLESDRAAADRAKLDLSYCQIRSPISGRAGNLLVHAGNLVAANGSALVVINRIAPLFVSFGIPQEQLSAVRQRIAAGRKLTVRATLQDNPGHASTGLLTLIDNTVDTNTGTIRLKGTFANEDHVLWPGQFVDVVLTLDTRPNATLIPAEAVQAGQKGQFVFVVKPDQTVESREVTASQAVGKKLVVESGVAPGETVVTDGQLRLFPGARIQPVAAEKLDVGGAK